MTLIDTSAIRSIHIACGKVSKTAFSPLIESIASSQNGTQPAGGQVEIAAHLVYELDPDGKQLRVVKFSEYAADKVRTLYPSAGDLRKQWADPMMRAEIISKLEERGIDFDQLRSST